MTLTLVNPSTGPVVNHSSGLITVRCADYVGPARAGLGTTADSLAAAGTAVTEEQTIAVQTSFASTAASRWAMVDDTVVIPIGDLNRAANVRYVPHVSVRVEGDLPSNAQYGAGWLAYQAREGEGIGLAVGINTTYQQTVTWVPNYRVGNYVVTDFFNANLDYTESDSDDFVIRAWGVAGGDLMFFLETVYFVPIFENGATTRVGSQMFPANKMLQLTTNGTTFGGPDNDPTGLPFFGAAQHSVLPWRQSVWSPTDGGNDWGQLCDFQTSDEQATVDNLSGFGDLFGFPGKLSWLIIPVGSTDVAPETFMVDDFSVDQFDRATDTVKDVGFEWLRTVLQGTASLVQFFWDPPTNSRRGSFVEAGSGKCTTYFGSSVAQASTQNMVGGGTGWQGGFYYGGNTLAGGNVTSDPNLPDNYGKLFQPYLESFEASVRASVLDFVADTQTVIGLQAESVGGRFVGAALRFLTSGDITLEIAKRENGVWDTFAGPVTVGSGLATGDWWWVKVEKRGYSWRARAWEDGTTEPTTWDVEGEESWRKLTTGTGFIDYVWETNWVGNVLNDTEGADPRGGVTGSFTTTGFPGVIAAALTNQARCRLEHDDFSAAYVPGTDPPGDITLHVEKYDGTVDYGTVTIPWGAHRFVTSSLALHYFNNDQDGVDIHLWKDSGTRELSTAGISRIFRWVKLTAGGVLSLSHLRVANRYGDRTTIRG